MIDWQRVTELREEIGEEDFREVAEMFLEEADDGVSRLKAGVPEDSLEAEYHALKGSGLNLGLSEFAKICADAEQHASAGAFENIDASVAVASYEASRTEFLNGLGLKAA